MTGKQIRKMRREVGISLQEMADALSCTRQNVHDMELRYIDRQLPGGSDNRMYKQLSILIEKKLKKNRKIGEKYLTGVK